MLIKNKMKNKRGQVTIFIIVAVLIIAAVALVFTLSPGLRTKITQPENPQEFIQTCLEDTIQEDVELLSLQGGSLEPEFSYQYEGNELQYLCYTKDYYKLCTVQVPFLRENIEEEIKNNIKDDVDICFNLLKETYENKNYQVNSKKGEIKVDLLPNKILTTINSTFTLTKGEDVKKYEKFNVIVNNNLYELVAIAQNIVEWETTYGEAEPDLYMDLYPDLKVEKHPQSDETYIYIITDKNTGNKFQFASRSLAYAPY